MEEEFLFKPIDYLAECGHVQIIHKPLINTTLRDLALNDWWISVRIRRIIMHDSLRIDIMFYNPGNPSYRMNVKFFDRIFHHAGKKIDRDFWLNYITDCGVIRPRFKNEFYNMIATDKVETYQSHSLKVSALQAKIAELADLRSKLAIEFAYLDSRNQEKTETILENDFSLEDVLDKFSEQEILKTINDRRYKTLDTSIIEDDNLELEQLIETIDNIVQFPIQDVPEDILKVLAA